MPSRVPTFKVARIKAHGVVDDQGRPNAYQRGYCDRRHFAWREAVLLRDAYTCRACGRVCTSKGEAHADHVSPVVPGRDVCRDGRSRYDVEAGQCLCASCHQVKTNEERVAANVAAPHRVGGCCQNGGV